MPIATAGLAYSVAVALGGSGFIAAFVGGAVFGGLRRSRGGEVGYLVEELGGVLDAITFLVFGAIMLEPALGAATLAIVVYAAFSLTLVRIVPVGIAMLGTDARRPTVGFLGWFGPRGLASIVFAVILVEEGGLPHEDMLVTTIVVTVALSVLAHGVTAAPLAGGTRPGTPPIRATTDPRSRAATGTHVPWRTRRQRAVAPTRGRSRLVEPPRRVPCRGRRGGRAVECGGLENRYGSLGSSRVQIPPSPLEQAETRLRGRVSSFEGGARPHAR